MYMMTPSDQISHDLSYFSGPRTSGAENKEKKIVIEMSTIEMILKVANCFSHFI